jgi:hypothetical protein
MKMLLKAFLSLALILPLTGCDSDDEATTNPAPGNAQFLAIHASPDAPGVDLLVDGTVVGTNLAFPNSTGYLSVPPGIRNVKVRVAGTSTTVIDANLPVAAGAYYTVIAADSVAQLTPLVLTDDLTSPTVGNAHVRFVHLSPNAPAVDIAVQGGGVLFPNISFLQSTPFTPVPLGTYNLEVRVAGTTTVVLSLSGVSLGEQGIYTLWASGFVGGSGIQALEAQTIVNKAAATPARVMAVHASPDAPDVDLLIDNNIAGTGLSYPNNTAY